MITFIIKGIHKNSLTPEKCFAYIIDTLDERVIAAAENAIQGLSYLKENDIEIQSYFHTKNEEFIEMVLEYTEHCDPFFSIPNEVADFILDSVRLV